MLGPCNSSKFGAFGLDSPMICCPAKRAAVRPTRHTGRSALCGRLLLWEKARICVAISSTSRSPAKISLNNACFGRRKPLDGRPDAAMPTADERQQCLDTGLPFGGPRRVQSLLRSRKESKGPEVFLAPAESPEGIRILEATKVPCWRLVPRLSVRKTNERCSGE